MKKGTKIALAAAFGLILVGLILCASTWTRLGRDFSSFGTYRAELRTEQIDGTFSSIRVDSRQCDVRIQLAEDGVCRVTGTGMEGLEFETQVSDGLLTVTEKDYQHWYQHIGFFFWDEAEITIYLPQREYDAFTISTASGDITLARGLRFEEATMSSISGDVSIFGAQAKRLDLSSTSGDMTMAGLRLDDELRIDTTSGDIDLREVRAREIQVESTSGDMELEDVVAQGYMDVQSISGDMELERCDAANLYLQTTSGDISGLLLTGKQFSTHTASGEVEVPPSREGGLCTISTASGDIEMEVAR